MNDRLIIRASAEADISEAAVWYENQREGLGGEFLTSVRAVIEKISANPRQYQRIRRLPDVRRALTKQFPYRVFFVLENDLIVVFRVLHIARHDREWEGVISDI